MRVLSSVSTWFAFCRLQWEEDAAYVPSETIRFSCWVCECVAGRWSPSSAEGAMCGIFLSLLPICPHGLVRMPRIKFLLSYCWTAEQCICSSRAFQTRWHSSPPVVMASGPRKTVNIRSVLASWKWGWDRTDISLKWSMGSHRFMSLSEALREVNSPPFARANKTNVPVGRREVIRVGMFEQQR
jgi:hypothetical protein